MDIRDRFGGLFSFPIAIVIFVNTERQLKVTGFLGQILCSLVLASTSILKFLSYSLDTTHFATNVFNCEFARPHIDAIIFDIIDTVILRQFKSWLEFKDSSRCK